MKHLYVWISNKKELYYIIGLSISFFFDDRTSMRSVDVVRRMENREINGCQGQIVKATT